jgi:hypothetical protein
MNTKNSKFANKSNESALARNDSSHADVDVDVGVGPEAVADWMQVREDEQMQVRWLRINERNFEIITVRNKLEAELDLSTTCKLMCLSFESRCIKRVNNEFGSLLSDGTKQYASYMYIKVRLLFCDPPFTLDNTDSQQASPSISNCAPAPPPTTHAIISQAETQLFHALHYITPHT